LPVVVFYTTAIMRPDGTVFFFEDIYQHEKLIGRPKFSPAIFANLEYFPKKRLQE
jgi:hypothetical protein